MRILLTGASGFVGSHVTEALAPESHRLLLLSADAWRHPLPPEAKVLHADLGTPDTWQKPVEEFAPDACIHLAWEGIPDYSEEPSRRNLLHSTRLFDHLAANTPCQNIVVSGSCFEYGRSLGECSEDDAPAPGLFFSWAKVALLEYLRLLAAKHKMEWHWLRIFYVYGPRQRPAALVPSLLRSCLEGTPPKLQTPRNANDFVYAGDVGAAFSRALSTSVPSGIYNLGSGQATPVGEIAALAEKIVTGACRPVEDPVATAHIPAAVDFHASPRKSAELLGWQAQTGLEEGIRQTLAWMKSST